MGPVQLGRRLKPQFLRNSSETTTAGAKHPISTTIMLSVVILCIIKIDYNLDLIIPCPMLTLIRLQPTVKSENRSSKSHLTLEHFLLDLSQDKIQRCSQKTDNSLTSYFLLLFPIITSLRRLKSTTNSVSRKNDFFPFFLFFSSAMETRYIQAERKCIHYDSIVETVGKKPSKCSSK